MTIWLSGFSECLEVFNRRPAGDFATGVDDERRTRLLIAVFELGSDRVRVAAKDVLDWIELRIPTPKSVEPQ
jgi:hypothetical protein